MNNDSTQDRAVRVLSVISKHHGLANIISGHEVGRRAGIRQRAVGPIVTMLRHKGHLIGSVHGKGYYMIETLQEFYATRSHIEGRKAAIDETIACLDESWERFESERHSGEQLTL